MKPETRNGCSLGIFNILRGECQGIALLAALILMTIVGLMGTSILIATSTEISISGNYRRGKEAFYLAEAGIEEVRARLRGSSSGTQGFIGDPESNYNSQWSAYILTSSDWKPLDDESYSERSTNYIPTQSSQTNTAIVGNSFQTALPYWVKVRHKTEYEAENHGHRPGSPHYLDSDGILKKHTKGKRGNVIFYGYPTNDSTMPIEFTTTRITDVFPVEMLTAHATLKGASSVIEVEVIHHPGPRTLGALYARNGVSLKGTSSTITGVDNCGAASSRAPVYNLTPSVTIGNATFQGDPPGPSQGPLEIDMPSTIGSLRKGARLLTTDQIGVTLGSSTDPWTVYTDVRNTGMFTIQNTVGFGVLLVEGHVQIKGPFNWHGLMVNSGTLILDGSNGPIKIGGGVWSDQVTHLAGELSIIYDSCAIKTSLLSRPLTITQWRQLM
ncbi:MAG: pilus assembly PilX N-terminal domain-containing protein [Nitrospirota bacterium]|nr:MAG: pilus assembly PilX N-terminal domain-containing protein [Nitrospirota bacterium]